jgi:four helix bundle protein
MTWERFEDIVAWQKGQDLAVLVYQHFGKSRDFSFKDQICRASVSISNNIAEGFERGSSKEFIRYLRISLGSCSEVRSMVYLAYKLQYVDEAQQKYLLNLTIEISKIIKGIIKSLI